MRMPNGYGSIVNLGKNRRKPWGVRITIGWGDDNRQKYKYLGYFEKKTQAIEFLADYNRNPYDVDLRSMTFGEVIGQWWEKHQNKIERSTYHNYVSAMRRMDGLNGLVFKDMKVGHLQPILDDAPPSTAKVIRNILSMVYRHALANEIADKDYSKLLTIKKMERQRPISIFTKKEIDILWKNEGPVCADMRLVLLYSGMRITELLTLETKNIDFKGRFVIGGIKTENGKNRIIPIHKKTFPIIMKNMGRKYIFPAPRGGRLYANNTGRELTAYMRSLGMKHTIHETRHTFTSQCSRLGFDYIVTKSIIGHSKSDITERYTHKSAEDLVKAIDAFHY